MILREYLRHIIVSDKLLLVKLCEYSFGECLLDCLEVYHPEPCEDAVLPVTVSKESVKVWMVVQRLASSLYGEDSRKFMFVDAERLRERPPSGTKENSVKLSVVLKEDS